VAILGFILDSFPTGGGASTPDLAGGQNPVIGYLRAHPPLAFVGFAAVMFVVAACKPAGG
jgi:hypothetical protein